MSGWPVEKIQEFRKAFETFLGNCFINSKETGGHTCLGEQIYYAQKVALDAIFDGLRTDRHDFKFLKSRQLGLSTITRAVIVFWCGWHQGIQGAMVFDTDVNKENARREIEDMIDNLPAWLRFPKIKLRNRYGIILSNGSKIQFMAAGVSKRRTGGGLGRSMGFNVCWCSEMCSWENAEGIVAFKESLSETFENRLYIWESTGRGFNEWHTMWAEAREDTLAQVATFLGWYLKDNQRIPKDSPSFEKYGGLPPSEKEAERIKEVYERYGHLVTQEQLAWYRRKMDPTRSKEPGDPEDTTKIQEQPWTEDECFQSTGAMFFSNETLTPALAAATKERFKGYRFIAGAEFLGCYFEPARSIRDVNLKVWEEPDVNGEYIVAADPAFGHDEANDRSCAQVFRCYADCIEQVAEFTSASSPTNQFAWLLASLIGWYRNVGQFILEINGPGEAVWNEYRSLKQIVTQGYLRQAAREKGLSDIFNNVRAYIYARSDSMGAGFNWQWKTTGQLKVAIMERLRDAHSSGTLVVRSVDALEEMRSVTRDGDTIKAEGDKKDDRVIGLALGVRAWEDRIRRNMVTQNRTKKAEMARVAADPRSRYQVFNQYQIDKLFKDKARARIVADAEARRRAWRGR